MKNEFLKLLFIALFFFLWNGNSKLFAQQNSYRIIIDPLLDSVNVPIKDHNIFKALEFLQVFLKTPNDSLLENADKTNFELKRIVYKPIFSSIASQTSEITFHVLNYSKKGNDILFEVIEQFNSPEWNVNYILNYFSICVRNYGPELKIHFLFTDYLNSLKKIESKWIDYYIKPSDELTISAIHLANQFCDSISSTFSLTKSTKLNYLVCEKNRILEPFGLYYSINSPGSRTIKLQNNFYVFDDSYRGNFKHELVHFLFRDYQDFDSINILDEGVATWLAGPGSVTFEEAKSNLKTIKSLDGDILHKIVEHRLPYWRPTYFYALGGLIVQHAYKIGGVKLIKNLLQDKSSKDIFEIVKHQFNLKSQTPEEFMISLIKNG